jgi:hypothetical protein
MPKKQLFANLLSAPSAPIGHMRPGLILVLVIGVYVLVRIIRMVFRRAAH